MSKQSYISRYRIIIEKLNRSSYLDYEQLKIYIQDAAEEKMRDDPSDILFSKRTLQRDIKDIRSLFGIDIEYSKSQKAYYISSNEAQSTAFERLMENFDIINSLNLVHNVKQFIHLEKRKPQGTSYLPELIKAIKNRSKIKFTHYKFWENEEKQILGEPYGLKEFKNRWYLIAKNTQGNMRSFALDRLSQLQIIDQKFSISEDYSIEESFQYSFGIMNAQQQEPQDVVLSFTHFQGKYIKSLPLHHSQEILVDDDKELRIQLKIRLTHDFLMELMSFGHL